jgi:hypothetical protein
MEDSGFSPVVLRSGAAAAIGCADGGPFGSPYQTGPPRAQKAECARCASLDRLSISTTLILAHAAGSQIAQGWRIFSRLSVMYITSYAKNLLSPGITADILGRGRTIPAPLTLSRSTAARLLNLGGVTPASAPATTGFRAICSGG